MITTMLVYQLLVTSIKIKANKCIATGTLITDNGMTPIKVTHYFCSHDIAMLFASNFKVGDITDFGNKPKKYTMYKHSIIRPWCSRTLPLLTALAQ